MRKEIRNLILSLGMLVLALVSVIASIFAWFTSNQQADASNISVDSSNENLYLRVLIEIKSSYKGVLQSDTFYKRLDGTDYFYEYDLTGNQYILDSSNNKISMDFTSLYPNEYVDITLWYRIDSELIDKDYKIILTDFDDSNGKFSIKNNETGESFQHSALGIFGVGEVVDGTSPATYNYLLDYNGDYESDTVYREVPVKRGKFSDETTEHIGNFDYYKTTFRILLDLTNYSSKLPHSSTNALSELYVIIGKIRIIC